MTAAPARRQSVGVVELLISIETTHPPAGRVGIVEGGPALPFVGWLQLLTILADAVQPVPAPGLTPPSETEP